MKIMKSITIILSLFTLFSCRHEFTSCTWVKPSDKEQIKEAKIEKNPSYIQSSYLIGKEPVSNNEYLAFLESFKTIYGTDSALKFLPFNSQSTSIQYFNDSLGSNPVINISRFKAQAYCQWLGEQENYQTLVEEGLIIENNNVNEDCGGCTGSFEEWVQMGYSIKEISTIHNDSNEFRKVHVSNPIYSSHYWLLPYLHILEEFKQQNDSESLPCQLFDVKDNAKTLKIDTLNCGFRIGYSPNSKLLIN